MDPMLATGGSAEAAIAEMKKRGCKHIKLMVLVAAPEGIEHIQELYPDVDIYAVPWTSASMKTATSFPAWATPATGFSAPSKSVLSKTAKAGANAPAFSVSKRSFLPAEQVFRTLKVLKTIDFNRAGKAAKRRRGRIKRAAFEETARLAAH